MIHAPLVHIYTKEDVTEVLPIAFCIQIFKCVVIDALQIAVRCIRKKRARSKYSRARNWVMEKYA